MVGSWICLSKRYFCTSVRSGSIVFLIRRNHATSGSIQINPPPRPTLRRPWLTCDDGKQQQMTRQRPPHTAPPTSCEPWLSCPNPALPILSPKHLPCSSHPLTTCSGPTPTAAPWPTGLLSIPTYLPARCMCVLVRPAQLRYPTDNRSSTNHTLPTSAGHFDSTSCNVACKSKQLRIVRSAHLIPT